MSGNFPVPLFTVKRLTEREKKKGGRSEGSHTQTDTISNLPTDILCCPCQNRKRTERNILFGFDRDRKL
jgi:hypothetical protein